MADLHDTANHCCSSSSEPDDISLFLHHFLLRSSSWSPFPAASSTRQLRYSGHENQEPPVLTPVSAELNPSTGGCFPGSSVVEYDRDSEEAVEAAARTNNATRDKVKSSSKRSRAAEVHNLSEKRRRSRINEKMKALQNLIPNSNKTDKASMLDEAIEYLKQLQLQVQILTMRNGLSMYPISMPGTKMEGHEESRLFTMAKELKVDKDTIHEHGDNCVKRRISLEELMGAGKNLGEDCNSADLAGCHVRGKGNSPFSSDKPPFSKHESAPKSTLFTGDMLSLTDVMNVPTFSPRLTGFHIGGISTSDKSKPDNEGF